MGHQISQPKKTELEELEKLLNDARQRQLGLLLTSISTSSSRLETVTKNLQETSSAQVKVTGRLLASSKRLEKLTVWLLVLGSASIVLLVENQLSPLLALVLIVMIFLLMF